MTQNGARRARWSVLAGTVLLAGLVGVAGRPPVVRGAEPTHLAGVVTWVFLYGEQDDDPNCGPKQFEAGSQGTLNLRMQKVGGSWIDAGSTYTEVGGGTAAACDGGADLGYSCWITGNYGQSGGHGRVVDPADHASWIVLNLDSTPGKAHLTFSAHGIRPFHWWTLVGGECPGSSNGKQYAEERGGLLTGGGSATCPLEDGVHGTVNATGTLIDFTCLRSEHGVLANSGTAYTWITRTDGRVRLTP